MLYMQWQINDMKNSEDSVRKALAHFEEKYGAPPQILEHSVKFTEIKVPDGLTFVRAIQIPKNILLIGEVEDDNP